MSFTIFEIASKKFSGGITPIKDIVRNQIESVFAAPYQTPGTFYTPITPPSGYTVTAEALTYDALSTDIQIVRVTVQRHGQTVETFETLRANR